VLSGSIITQSATALELSFDKFLEADDKSKFADQRENLQKNLQLIFFVFKQFGLICHWTKWLNYSSKSKTEAMYFVHFAALGPSYEDDDTSPLLVESCKVPFIL
jgi:hypothetical protein